MKVFAPDENIDFEFERGKFMMDCVQFGWRFYTIISSQVLYAGITFG